MGFVTRQVRVGYLQNSQTHPNARNDLLLTVVTLEIESHRKPSPRDLDTLCPQVCVSVKVLVCPWSLPVSFAPSCWPGSSVVTQMPHWCRHMAPCVGSSVSNRECIKLTPVINPSLFCSSRCCFLIASWPVMPLSQMPGSWRLQSLCRSNLPLSPWLKTLIQLRWLALPIRAFPFHILLK